MTPTTAAVGHGSKDRTIVQIDGFRGRLISADDADYAGEVLRFYHDFVRDAPDELGTVVRFGSAPPLPVINIFHHNQNIRPERRRA